MRFSRDSTLHRRVVAGSALTALLGCAAVAAANLVGVFVVDEHDILSDTISKLAIGPYAWIQDLGLDAFALALFALALGLALVLPAGWRGRLGLASLVVLSADVVLIAEHNQYAGRPGRGAAIHIYLVYALYGLFAAALLLLARPLKALGDRWPAVSLGAAGAWLVLAPLFFLVPDAWDGGYERFLALFLLLWVAGVAWALLRSGPTVDS